MERLLSELSALASNASSASHHQQDFLQSTGSLGGLNDFDGLQHQSAFHTPTENHRPLNVNTGTTQTQAPADASHGSEVVNLKAQVDYLAKLLLAKQAEQPRQVVVNVQAAQPQEQARQARRANRPGPRGAINDARGFSRILMNLSNSTAPNTNLYQQPHQPQQQQSSNSSFHTPSKNNNFPSSLNVPTSARSERSNGTNVSAYSYSRSEPDRSYFHGAGLKTRRNRVRESINRGRILGGGSTLANSGNDSLTGTQPYGRAVESHSAPLASSAAELDENLELYRKYAREDEASLSAAPVNGYAGGGGYNAALAGRMLRVDRLARSNGFTNTSATGSDAGDGYDNIKAFFNGGGGDRKKQEARKMSVNMVETMKKVYLAPPQQAGAIVASNGVTPATGSSSAAISPKATSPPNTKKHVVSDMDITNQEMMQVAKYFGVDEDFGDDGGGGDGRFSPTAAVLSPTQAHFPSSSHQLLSPVRISANVGANTSWSPPITPGGEMGGAGQSVDEMISWVGTLNEEEFE
jgi:hypothetical protein